MIKVCIKVLKHDTKRTIHIRKKKLLQRNNIRANINLEKKVFDVLTSTNNIKTMYQIIKVDIKVSKDDTKKKYRKRKKIFARISILEKSF